MIRVAYLSLMAPPGEPAGSGVPKVTETLLREYEAMGGLDVQAVTLVDDLPEARTETKGAVTYHYLPCKSRGKTFTFYWQEVRTLRRWLDKVQPAVIHGQPTSEYLLAATGTRVPSVITIHGLVLREAKGMNRFRLGTLAHWIRETAQRRAAKRVRDVISISPYVDEYLAGWCGARIHSISNPIDSEFFDVPPARGGVLRLLCVGVVSTRKNQLLLVQACGLLKKRGIPFECRIVGRPQPEARHAIESEIASSGLGDVVRLCGLVSREELRDTYDWCNAVVLPSREETAPLSLIQAMAAGRPAVGAASAGIPALLEHGKVGDLFDGNSPEALAALLTRRSKELDSWLERSAGFKVEARSRYHPREVASATAALYQGLSTFG